MDNLIEKLKNGEKLTVREIGMLARTPRLWQESLGHLLAKRALDMGENFYAYDIAEKIPQRVCGGIDLKKLHIMGLALARSGSLGRAAELLQSIPRSDDPEIVGLKSRILKDMAVNTVNMEHRRQLFLESANRSLEIFRAKKQYYNGINAASCLFMAGQKAQAQQLVRDEVLKLCLSEKKSDFWLEATLGECYLLLEEFEEAGKYYARTARTAIETFQLGNLASSLKQLNMLSEYFEAEAVRHLHEIMNLPAIAIFSGHMIDRPERKTPRFPAAAEAQVREALAEIIRRRNIRLAYVSCACGGDIIFIEEMLKNNGECFIMPPLPMEATIRNSVDIIPGGDWKARLEKILQDDRVVLSEAESDEIGEESDNIVYDFANRLLLGSAINKAAQLHFPLCGVTVWNLEKSGLPGGTDSAVALWQQKNIPIEIVTPETAQ